MDYTHRVRPGPTLDECAGKGATHLELHCLNGACGHKARLEIGEVKAPPNTPVNHMNWRCARCRGINITVGLVIPKQPVTPEPVFEMKSVRPRARRAGCAGVKAKR